MRLCTSLTVLGLLALPLACTAFQPVSHAVHSAIKLCNGFDQELCNAVPACSYCVSRFGEAHCFATAVTPSLPDDLYPCRFWPSNGPSNACEGKAEGDCKASSCAWCVSAAVGSACYTPEDAKRLPSAIFSCSMPSLVNATHTPAPAVQGVDTLGARSHLSLAGDVAAAAQAGADSEASSG